MKEDRVRSQDLISISSSGGEVAALKQKSAGLAWGLSMIIPGAGHFYCGTKLRGGLVLGLSVMGMLAMLGSVARTTSAGDGTMIGGAMILLPVLYVFGFVDAYFTAREIDRGIDPVLVDNPRVACVLNLLTRGFGYFYLGERAKGVIVFVGLGLGQVLIPLMLGGGVMASVVSLLLVLVSIGIAIDAYRLGNQSLKAQIAGMELPAPAPPSRIPPFVPLLVGGAILAALLGLLLLGFVVLLAKGGPA
jgi:hypothetical protein